MTLTDQQGAVKKFASGVPPGSSRRQKSSERRSRSSQRRASSSEHPGASRKSATAAPSKPCPGASSLRRNTLWYWTTRALPLLFIPLVVLGIWENHAALAESSFLTRLLSPVYSLTHSMRPVESRISSHLRKYIDAAVQDAIRAQIGQRD